MAKYDGMVAYRRAVSREKTAYVKGVVDKMVASGDRITPYTVWVKAGVSKSLIYRNKKVKEYIEKNRTRV